MRDVTIRLRLDDTGFRGKMANASASTRAFMSDLEKSSQKRQALDEIGGSFGRIGLAAGVAGGLAVRAFANFDEAMSAVAATGEDARASIDGLRDAAVDAGARTKYSATEAAAGIENLLKAGVSAKDVMGGGLDAALDLAAAGSLDVAEAAEYAATAMGQFKLGGKDVGGVADALAAGAGKAMGEVGDLGQALNQAGLVSSQMGVSMQETVGSLSAFAQAGLLGSDAGTSLRTMLLRLANPTKESSKLMQQLGIDAYDSSGKFVGVAEVAGDLQRAFEGKTQAERDSAMATIFGSDAIRAANVLYSEGSSGIQQWTKDVSDQGYAAEVAARKMDNLKGDFEQLKGSLETALIGTGEGADGPLRELTQSLDGVVDAYNRLPQGAKDAALGVTGLTAVVGGGTWAVSKAITGYAALQDNLRLLGVRSREAGVEVEGLTRKQIGLRVGVGAAGLGLAALSSKADDTNKGLGVLTDTAAGAALGFGVAGPWGAAIGGAAGLMKGLAGQAGRTDKALGRTEGFETAKTAAAQLTEQLIGTKNAYNDVTAATVRQGLIGKDGGPVGWVKELQGAGLSIDTITRAILGQRDAVKLVDQAWRDQGGAITEYDAKIAAVQGKMSALLASGGPDGIATDTVKQGKLADLRDEMDKLSRARDDEKADLAAAKKAYDALAGPVEAQAKKERDLAAQLGLSRKAYDSLPKSVRTKVEADGLPDTFAGLRDLLAVSGDLDGKEIAAIVRASGVQLTKGQLANLEKKFGDLDGITATPRVRAQVSGMGDVAALASKIESLRSRSISVRAAIHEDGENANGGLYSGRRRVYADGGIDEFGRRVRREPQLRSGAQGTVMWGEPETGWEAYISGKPGKRDRNRFIADQAVSRLGGSVEWFADGGITAVDGSEYTRLRIRVRDLQRDLAAWEKTKNGRRRKLRGLDRAAASQELAEAKRELAAQRSIRGAVRGAGGADAYNDAQDAAQEAAERARQEADNRRSAASQFASGLSADAFKSPASLDRALTGLVRDSAEYTMLLGQLAAAGASPWLLEQIKEKAGPSRATNRTLRALLGDSGRLARLNALSSAQVATANTYAALTTSPGFSATYSGATTIDYAALAQAMASLPAPVVTATTSAAIVQAGSTMIATNG